VISRYTRKEMADLWSDTARFGAWLEIEILACEEQAKLGRVPPKAVSVIRRRAKFDPARIEEIERETKHDVIAFLTNIGEHVGPDSRYIHLGMTSSDVLDTGLAIQMKRSAQLLLKDLHGLAAVLKRRAGEFKKTVMIGRTHGIHAEPTTFGLKLALWYDETLRHIDRLTHARDTVSVGQISGAVGTFEHIDPSVERYVCGRLGLTPASISTQVLQRDRHAEFMTALAVIGCSLEKFATEIRHLQKTEVLEVEEYFSKGQKGSSAMPHKRNPITCERIAGLSRVLRGNALAAMENVALWHERDISHSSVERVIIPDSCILLDYMLVTFTKVIDQLLVYPENMKKNIELTHGLVHSQAVMLALTGRGMRREEAYAIVQKHAMETWETKKNFKVLISADAKIRKMLSKQEIDAAFNSKKALANVDYIFKRVGI